MQPAGVLANRFAGWLVMWFVLLLVFIAAVLLKIEEVVFDAWEGRDQ
jgi:hypothetical protein